MTENKKKIEDYEKSKGVAFPYRAWHKEKKIMCVVLLICFVNEYVNVLPDYQLEGGNQEEWKFDEIELMQTTEIRDMKNMPVFGGDILDFDEKEWGEKGFFSVAQWDFENGEWDFGGGLSSDVPKYRK